MLTQKQDELLSLVKEKDQLEKDILDLTTSIYEFNKKGLDKDLVDKDGFPREDLNFGELYEYKTMKKKLSEKQNDLAALMKIIEKGLFSYHEYYKNSGQAEKDIENYEKTLPEKKEEKNIPVPPKPKQDKMEIENQEPEKGFSLPFSQITEVVEESPSFVAGIKLDDLIVKFGDCSYYNHNNLQYMTEVVKGNINREIEVELMRETKSEEKTNDLIHYQNKCYQVVKLVIIPKIWKGQGVLGCRFKNIT